jgi:GNAT superfamily N-acetyltransferase
MESAQGSLRRAGAADLAGVLDLDEAAPVGHARRSLLSSRLLQGHVLIYEEHGALLGFVVLLPGAFFGRDFIELIAVRASARRRGIGAFLVDRCVALSSTSRIFTSTNESHAVMRALLGSCGWRFSGTLGGIDEGDPELVFYRDRTTSDLS